MFTLFLRPLVRNLGAIIESIYTVFAPQDAPVELGDWYRDETEGAVFHVTSRPNERMTPTVSPLGMKLFKAEKKELPA